MTVTKLRLWQGSENCLWRPQGILRFFLSGFFALLFWPFYRGVWWSWSVHAFIMEFMDSDVEGLLLTKNCFLQGAWEPNFSMVRTGRSTECFSRPYNDCYRWQGRIWKEEGIFNTTKYTELLNTSWAVRVSSELSGRRKTTILSLETVRHFPKSILRFWISLTRTNLNIGSANSSSKFKLV